MKSFLYAGIEIGGTKLQMVVGNSEGRIIDKRRFNVDKSLGADGIRRTIEAQLPELIRHKEVRKIAVGFGGPVDWRNGKICRSHQIEGWSDFDIARWLKSITGIDVVVENDANTGALGEAICGSGRGFNPVFFVTLGSGVGGGLVVDGGIYHGDLPGECE
ncbi:MAG TPA: ROK family protein, partial [Verrucomicrobiota bacterium]|nr:ROK family protein [Verrucomicrobiota bacterium]